MEESPNRTTTDLAKAYGSNWTKANVTTMFEWLAIAAYNIRSLELSILYYRGIIRRYTIYGLFISTLTGTLSVIQLNTSNSLPSTVITILNSCFTFFSFTIAIFTGFIKVYQIQEQLEHFIKLKQDWIVFSTSIASELQLPVELRRDALFLIMKNKNIYLDLLKVDAEFPSFVASQVKKEMPFPDNLDMHASTLHEIVMTIGSQELKDLECLSARNKDRFSPPMTRKALPAIPENVIVNSTGSSVKESIGTKSKTPSATEAKAEAEANTVKPLVAPVATVALGSIAALPVVASVPDEVTNTPVAPTVDIYSSPLNLATPSSSIPVPETPTTATSPELTSITLTVNP
jgi:hypothetical protein